MTIRTTCLMAMCILDGFLQSTGIISSVPQEWHCVSRITFLCGATGSVTPILPRRAATFLLMDFIFHLYKQDLFSADQVFFPKNESLSKAVCQSWSPQIPAHSISKKFIQQETGKAGELQQEAAFCTLMTIFTDTEQYKQPSEPRQSQPK